RAGLHAHQEARGDRREGEARGRDERPDDDRGDDRGDRLLPGATPVERGDDEQGGGRPAPHLERTGATATRRRLRARAAATIPRTTPVSASLLLRMVVPAAVPAGVEQGSPVDWVTLKMLLTAVCGAAWRVRSVTSAECGRLASRRVSQTSAGCMPTNATARS